MPDDRPLASYRPTVRQFLGRTVFTGTMVALAAVIAVTAAAIWGQSSPLVYLVLLPFVAVAGFVGWTELGRRGGVDATDRGLRRVTFRRRWFATWQQVADIRTERRGWRTVVVIALTSGAQWRLRAPYDSRWLSHDPDFEPKLFYLRNLWETHRTWHLDGPAAGSGAPRAGNGEQS
ncbi:MAG: hypothetical protein ACRDT8_07475 [Micromonosporaceae bacterium]